MGLIKVEKAETKSLLKIQVSSSLANEFEKELANFNKNSSGAKLNFDSFVTKLIDELKKINSKNPQNAN